MEKQEKGSNRLTNEECVICYENICNNDIVSLQGLPVYNKNINCCKVQCHENCIDRWLKEKTTCPHCRAEWTGDEVSLC